MVYEFVRNHRKEQGLSQKQLAEKAGVSVRVVQKFEANRPYAPVHTTFAKIFWALGIDVTFAFLELEWPSRKGCTPWQKSYKSNLTSMIFRHC